MRLDDNGGWPARDSIPTNILFIYRPEGERERNFASHIENAHHGRLFSHEKCTGNRASYTIKHVNQLLENPENIERTKERLVELMPHLSPQQKKWLAEGISEKALKVVEEMDASVAESITALKQAATLGNTPRR